MNKPLISLYVAFLLEMGLISPPQRYFYPNNQFTIQSCKSSRIIQSCTSSQINILRSQIKDLLDYITSLYSIDSKFYIYRISQCSPDLKCHIVDLLDSKLVLNRIKILLPDMICEESVYNTPFWKIALYTDVTLIERDGKKMNQKIYLNNLSFFDYDYMGCAIFEKAITLKVYPYGIGYKVNVAPDFRSKPLENDYICKNDINFLAIYAYFEKRKIRYIYMVHNSGKPLTLEAFKELIRYLDGFDYEVRMTIDYYGDSNNRKKAKRNYHKEEIVDRGDTMLLISYQGYPRECPKRENNGS